MQGIISVLRDINTLYRKHHRKKAEIKTTTFFHWVQFSKPGCLTRWHKQLLLSSKTVLRPRAPKPAACRAPTLAFMYALRSRHLKTQPKGQLCSCNLCLPGGFRHSINHESWASAGSAGFTPHLSGTRQLSGQDEARGSMRLVAFIPVSSAPASVQTCTGHRASAPSHLWLGRAGQVKLGSVLFILR